MDPVGHKIACVFSITDLYRSGDFLFPKGFRNGFDGDSPLISRNTGWWCWNFVPLWRSINWSFLWFPLPCPTGWGHGTRVLRVWQLRLIWCKYLAKTHHCEPVNTGRGVEREYPLRVLKQDHLQYDLNSWTLHNTPMKRSQTICQTLHQFPFQHLPTIEQWSKPFFAPFSSLLHIGDNTTQYPVI